MKAGALRPDPVPRRIGLLIDKGDQETVALHPWSHVARKPFIQDMMQEYVF